MFKNKRLIFITSCLLLIINYQSFSSELLNGKLYINEVNKLVNAENLTYEDVKRLINEINRFVLYEKNYNSHILAKTEQFFLNNSKINVNLSKKYNKMLLHIYNIKLNENNLRCLR